MEGLVPITIFEFLLDTTALQAYPLKRIVNRDKVPQLVCVTRNTAACLWTSI
jgi:hypothetical protein